MEVFDPYARAWKAYDSGGLDELRIIEAPLHVYTAPDDVANAIAERNGIDPNDMRCMVIADAFPVASIHLNIVGHRQVPYDEAVGPEKDMLDHITRTVRSLVLQAINPLHGVADMTFGQQVPTMHRHVVAREETTDGLNWEISRAKISVVDRQRRIGRLAVPTLDQKLAAMDSLTTAKLSKLYLPD